jgi:trans-aconitate 2-methyltransferase
VGAAGFRWDARDYADNAANQRGWAREVVARLNLGGAERVLDIGCGDGTITAEIAERVPRGAAIGMDSSPDMIRLARERHPPERHPNLSFEVRDAADLRVPEPVDVAFSNAALHWVMDHGPVLAGVFRCLVPGGRAAFSFGGRGTAAEAIAVMDEVVRDSPWRARFEGRPMPYHFPEPEGYRRLLETAGLVPKRVELVPKVMALPGTAGMAGWIRTTWLPFLAWVPEAEREAFVTRVAEAYVRAYPPDADGTVRVRTVRLEVEAVRPG